MKNIIKILIVTLLLQSCGDFEPVYYDSSLNALGFSAQSSSVIVPEEGVTTTVTVDAINTSSSSRSYDLIVDMDLTTGDVADYTVGALTIPAGETQGSFDVTFGNFENLEELVTKKLVIKLDLPEGVGVVGFDETTINYTKYLFCNDLTLVLNEDAYADERNWNITDSDGTIVVQCSDYADCPNGAESGTIAATQYQYSFTLPDGCYTFNITDSFGDGQFDSNITGNYSLDCSVINHANGSGDWGSAVSTEFCVNP